MRKVKFSHLPRHRAIGQLLAISLLVFLLDQASKYWLIAVFQLPAKAPLHLGDYFSLVMAWNRGVSFSMLAHSAQWMPYALVVLAVGISGILARLCLRSALQLERIGYAMVIGGALANAFDRMRFGAVADFFYAHIGEWGWPAFNVADMAICAGVALLLWQTICRSK